MKDNLSKGPYGFTLSIDNDAINVSTSDGLEKWELQDASGSVIADVYGRLLLSHAGDGISICDQVVHFSENIDDTDTLERHVLDGLHGNWILVTRAPLARRVYMDYGGSLACVYSPTLKRAGSAALHVYDEVEYSRFLNHKRVDRLITAEGEHGWIPGTLTAHDGLWRLLPNHYLCLENFTSHRFWPRADFRFGIDFEEAAQVCANDIRSYVEAAAKQYQLGLSLTAGYDSRIVLSGGVNVPELLHAYTFRLPGLHLDSVIAPEICRRLGVRHTIIELSESDTAGKMWWDKMVGECVREVNRDIFPSLLNVPADMTLSGIYGETGRIRFYQKEAHKINEIILTASSILSRMTLPQDAELLNNVDGWLKPLQHYPSSVILDLAFVELKIASWGMGQSPAQKAFHPVMMPLAQRRVQAAMIGVDPVLRGNGPLFQRIGEINWPEAMEIDINRFGDYRDILAKINAGRKIEKIRRFLRHRSGQSE